MTAQYRELEAFSKFGSDLDASTLAVLDKGAKNVEILKQNQYSPVKVEEQVAIIYCGTNALLKDIPVQKVRAFEKDFIDFMRDHHSDTLETIRQGIINDDVITVLNSAAADVVTRYSVR